MARQPSPGRLRPWPAGRGPGPGVLALLPVALGACVSRVLPARQCGDGHTVAGEACFDDTAIELSVAYTPLALRVADFDGDTVPDVLLLGVDAAGAVTATMHQGQGDGTLAPSRDAGVIGCSAHPALGDANGDGAVDLLVDACDDTMLVYLADGSGGFSAPRIVDVDLATQTSAIADVDHDGTGDVVALGLQGEQVALAWARGTATGFEAPRVTVLATAGDPGAPTGFSLGALDDDGYDDALLSHATDAPAEIARGGPEGFGAREAAPQLPVATGIAVLDLDGNGARELLAVHSVPAQLVAYRGTLDALRRAGSTAIESVRDRLIAGGDVDGDERLDLGFFAPGERDVQLWLGDGRGGWSRRATVDVGVGVDQLALADLDGDGAADLVAGTFAAGGLRIIPSDP